MEGKNFFSRQLGRIRYFVITFAFLITVFNFINIFLLMLSNLDITIKWYWIIISYAVSIVLAPIISYIFEKMGIFQVDVLQRWKMSEKELYTQKIHYQATVIELQSRKTTDELLEDKRLLEEGWK